MIRHEAAGALAGLDARAVEYTVTDLFFAPAAELLAMLPMVKLPDAGRAAAYESRLAAVPGYLADVADRHRAGIAAGRVPVARLVAAAVAQLDRYLADPAGDPFRIEGAAVEPVLAAAVRPAFARYRDVLAEEVAPHGRPDERPGVCWLPGGEEAYAAQVRRHTSTDRTPEDLHRTGLELVAGLKAEITELAGRTLGVTDFADLPATMREHPALRWRDAEEMLAAARETIVRAEAAAPRWFGRLPGQPCLVEPVPPAAGPGSPAAYYLPPSLDGTRRGTYYANTYRAPERDRAGAEAIAFHEAVPGHHLQLSVAQELGELPMLRRVGQLTAYAEGWGLYAERLADEMGLYSGEIARLGMLSVDSRRTARLVVDTGMHAFGWSRDRAVDYLRENTTRPMVEITGDVDRFVAAPGQALAYTVGRLEIERIRASAERDLGACFDLRAFHDVVLGSGALPLSALADLVAGWVTDRRP